MSRGPDPAQLAQLEDVAGWAADRACQPVRAAMAKVNGLEAEIARTAAARRLLLGGMTDLSRAAALGQQAERLRRHQVALGTKLAAARAALVKDRKAAQKALARAEAIGRLQRASGRK